LFIENFDILNSANNDFEKIIEESDTNVGFDSEENMDSFIGNWEDEEDFDSNVILDESKIVNDWGDLNIDNVDFEFGMDMFEEEEVGEKEDGWDQDDI
jgi:hypothetical protein